MVDTQQTSFSKDFATICSLSSMVKSGGSVAFTVEWSFWMPTLHLLDPLEQAKVTQHLHTSVRCPEVYFCFLITNCEFHK